MLPRLLAALGCHRSCPAPAHSLDHLGHGDLGVLLEGVHHQPVAADVVHALQRHGRQVEELRPWLSPWQPHPCPVRVPTPQGRQESPQGANPGSGQRQAHGHTANPVLPACPNRCHGPAGTPWQLLVLRAPHPSLLGPTWLMSLVHAAFSCLDEATRITVKDEESFGSTTILKSRWSMSCPDVLALGKKNPTQ